MRSAALDAHGYGLRLASAREHAMVAPGPRAWFAVGTAALGAVIVIVASAPAVRVDRNAPRPGPVAVDAPKAEACPTSVQAWKIEADAAERIGYRGGQRHVFYVVPLGPTRVEVEVGTARAFLAMREAAGKACVDLGLVSGFRTAEEQRALFRAWRKGQGNKAARPGQSNHQSGRALDIALLASGAREWLDANAASFGFKRTVKSEPWHWEYVASPIARGATKRISRKLAMAGKSTHYVKRPAKRPSLAERSARGRVAASSR